MHSIVGPNQGVIVSVTRRYVDIRDNAYSLLTGKLSTKSLEATVGDLVEFEKVNDREIRVTAILPPKNFLSRTYNGQEKRLASNLDKVLVVSAVVPTFSCEYIDRVLVSASRHQIPCTLILNKIDLPFNDLTPILEMYRKLGYEMLLTSAKTGQGIPQLEELLSDPSFNTVVLNGISGVGKSSIIKRLIPGVEIRTQELGGRTQKGKQTTTHPSAYVYSRSSSPLLIVDLPGVQNFGLQHLNNDEVTDGFPEIRELAHGCKFGNCSHGTEPDCAVQAGMQRGEIYPTRFNNYLRFLQESHS